MRSGKLRHRVEIQSFQKTPDGYGGYIEDWVTDRTVWARIQPLKGSERFQAQQVQAELSHQIMMRFTDLKPSQRLKHKERIFKIDSVLPDETLQKELTVICAEELP